MYQQKFRSTPLFERLVKPFIERLPKTSGCSVTIIYPRTRTYSSVCQQWYNWLKHHADGLYKVSCDPTDEEHHWKLIITRREEEAIAHICALREELPKEEKDATM